MFASALSDQVAPDPESPALVENVAWYRENREAVRRLQTQMEAPFPEDDAVPDDIVDVEEAAPDVGVDAEEGSSEDADSTAIGE